MPIHDLSKRVEPWRPRRWRACRLCGAGRGTGDLAPQQRSWRACHAGVEAASAELPAALPPEGQGVRFRGGLPVEMVSLVAAEPKPPCQRP